jgi:ABC-type transport system substrate-binding protein
LARLIVHDSSGPITDRVEYMEQRAALEGADSRMTSSVGADSPAGVLPRRSRRSVLGLALGAGALAIACGRGGKSSAPGVSSEPPRRFRQNGAGPFGPAGRGGVLRHRIDNDYVNLDPHATAQASAQWVGMLALSRLLRFATGPGEENLASRVIPEMTTSTGESIDGSIVVFRLRDDLFFHDVPPVYGRRVVANDVRLSFERAKAGKSGMALSGISSVQTPDDRTMIFRLRRPTVTLPTTLASANGLFIMPYEADVRFDPARTPIGAGPWILEKLEPAVQVRWKANPRYFLNGVDGKALPYADALVEKVIPEDATAAAQFSAGELDIVEMASHDLFAIQDAAPEAQITAFPAQGLSFMGFSSRPDQPFRDVRVRQAFSMALDRQALYNVSYDTDKLEREGFPVLRQHPASPLPAHFKFWVDPAARPWGYQYGYRPAEARRLLAAAGWDFDRTVPFNFTNNRYGRAYSDSFEAIIQLLSRIGVKVQAVGHDYSSAWVDVWQKGEFDGIGYFAVARFAEPHDYFARVVHSKGQFNPGRVRDPVLDALIEKDDTIFDAADREQVAREIVNRVNDNMYIPPLSLGTTMQYNVAQPWLGNAQQFYTTNTGAWYAEVFPHYWVWNRE